MATFRYKRLLYLVLFFTNTIPLIKSQSNTLFVASPSIGTYTQGTLSVLEIRQANSEIQCAMQCLDIKQCMAIKYGQAESECRLYHGAEYLEEHLPQQVFRAIDCPDGWISFDKSCYQLNLVKLSWHAAMEACKVMGGYLVEIESARENNFVTGLILESTEADNCYIGATDETVEGEWIWKNSGNQMVYNNWCPGEPNGQGSENYASISFQWTDGMWNDKANIQMASMCEI